MAEDNVLSSAIDFYQKIKAEDEVRIKFRKLSGEERIMRCTLDFSKVPNNKKPKDVNIGKILKLVQDHKMVHVFDLDIGDWRTVPFDRSEWLETDTARFRIKK